MILQLANRKRAWHFFEPVEVEVNGVQEAFLSNISVIEYRDAGERIFSLELTIENPVGDREDMWAPQKHGRQALHPNGVSDVRLAAFDSFVKKERAKIERKAREKGMLPWRVDEARVNELRGEADKIRKDIEALLAKFGGDKTKLQQYRRDRKKLHALREALERKQEEIDAESKPAGMPDLDAPLAPNGKLRQSAIFVNSAENSQREIKTSRELQDFIITLQREISLAQKNQAIRHR